MRHLNSSFELNSDTTKLHQYVSCITMPIPNRASPEVNGRDQNVCHVADSASVTPSMTLEDVKLTRIVVVVVVVVVEISLLYSDVRSRHDDELRCLARSFTQPRLLPPAVSPSDKTASYTSPVTRSIKPVPGVFVY